MNLAISGMHCGACVARVKSALAPLTTVASVEVGTAQVVVNPGVDLNAINSALAVAGAYVATASSVAAPVHGKPIGVPVRSAKAIEPERLNEAAQIEAPQTVTFSVARWLATYQPVLMIVGFVLGAALVLQWREAHFDPSRLMQDFMGGFFIAFAFFKLLNWRGFVDAFKGYDWLGQRLALYAWAYPLIELALGVGYLLRFDSIVLNSLTLSLMLLGSWGVVRALRSGKTLQCACLGTVFNLPMSSVALIENLSMALMAGVMLLPSAAR